MISENTISLVIPPVKEIREEIRQNVDQYFAANRIIPPVSYNKLSDLADFLLAKFLWDKSYKAFVMICCGNTIWRPVVGAIPFNRRMLLLPQCLKNSNSCKGVVDELGLLCAECGSCNISGFLKEAEKLGYLTVVSEGTTVASRLVESGKVDAVIGVGCMEVLQKIFIAVNKFSIPSIGVPLLSCGCIDTTADAAWIRQEINHLEDRSGYRFVNLNDLSDKVRSFFTVAQINRTLDLKGTATDKIVLEVILAGGKRIRPLLSALAYDAFSQNTDPETMKNLAFSIECFHKASLIHDDIEDNDPTRYGKETLHTKYGIPVAINAGDLLIGEGYRLITDSGLDAASISKCISIVSKGHKAMSVGQGAELIARRNNELISTGDLLTIFENKSAEAFRVALLMGAVAGGAEERTLDLLDKFSSHIGRAYQMKDDLEDLSDGNDLKAVKNPSAIISVLVEKATEKEIDELKSALDKNEITDIQYLIVKYQVREVIGNMIREHLSKLDQCLSELQNIPLKIALYEIAGRIFRDYL